MATRGKTYLQTIIKRTREMGGRDQTKQVTGNQTKQMAGNPTKQTRETGGKLKARGKRTGKMTRGEAENYITKGQTGHSIPPMSLAAECQANCWEKKANFRRNYPSLPCKTTLLVRVSELTKIKERGKRNGRLPSKHRVCFADTGSFLSNRNSSKF